jgi:hypothetical protein
MIGPSLRSGRLTQAVRARRHRLQGPRQELAIAFEAVRKIDAVFMAERANNGLLPKRRLAVRRAEIAPMVRELIAWMTADWTKLFRHNEVAKAMDYMLKGSRPYPASSMTGESA